MVDIIIGIVGFMIIAQLIYIVIGCLVAEETQEGADILLWPIVAFTACVERYEELKEDWKRR